MALTFDYKVRDQAGSLIEGRLEGDSMPLVVNKLREMGYLPVTVSPVKGDNLRREIVIPGISDRIRGKEVALFTRQFATMVDSGLSINRSLAVLGTQTENKYLAAKIKEIREDVESGMALSAAFAKHPKVFDTLYVSMLQAGEVGGNIDLVLKTLAGTIERNVELNRKIKGAMTYPIVVVSVIGFLFLVMMVVIVPVFKHLFATLGGVLPLPTRILITVSNTLLSWRCGLVILAVVAMVMGLRRWISTEGGRRKWDGWKLRIPIFGNLMHKTALSRFASTLSSLLSAGVPVLEALDIVSRAAGNVIVSKAVDQTKEGVRVGRSFAEPMRENPIFPTLVTQMVEVGEQTGALDEMLDKVSEYYNGEINQTVDNLTSILEPVLIVVMGVVIGAVIISLYLPMFDYVKLLKS